MPNAAPGGGVKRNAFGTLAEPRVINRRQDDQRDPAPVLPEPFYHEQMVIPGRCNGGKRLYHWRLQTQIKRKRIYETHNVWWVAVIFGGAR